MATGNTDQTQLIGQITEVLTRNPQLVARLGFSQGAAGAPGNVCTTCNTCDHNCPSSAPDAVRTIIGGNRGARVRGRLGDRNIPADIAKLIDHTLLKADATYDDIDQLCSEAREYGFASVCVNPFHIKRCAASLRGSGVGGGIPLPWGHQQAWGIFTWAVLEKEHVWKKRFAQVQLQKIWEHVYLNKIFKKLVEC